MRPFYTPENTSAAFQLNWGLALFWRDAAIPDTEWLVELQEATEPDGILIKRHRITPKGASQFFVSTRPAVAPMQLIARVKGRLQYLVRAVLPKAFQRNYGLRSVGSAKRSVVEDYVATQLDHHRMADPQVELRFKNYQRSFPNVDLSEPASSAHGRYWYNLHVAIVNERRLSEINEVVLTRLTDAVVDAAARNHHRLSRLAVLADHLHLTLGCNIEEAPQDVALSYMNNCAHACGMKPVYQYSYYVGTIGEYDRGAT